MGNSMGNVPNNGLNRFLDPEVTPGPNEKPTFDPCYGFRGTRKERKMIASEAQMRSAKIPLKERDYCAHLLISYRACRKDVWPFVLNCEHEKHAYLNCQYEDFVLRMKEYERERRLRVRSVQEKSKCK
ncbi:hypothetical protein RN001_012202 [Aquatica leii]|uniref:NADH dehydrogenase [ubiquinone] 1 beta subcomplex subunit 7 n=1 Tax=Aquatica leii TaxID=1421715 RepID=A0AAN7Q1E1_9COLE|nr:hypothetical protein RN001_012202 [Aquatica leii]